MINQIPENIKEVLKALNDSSFQAYVVGGCVRDLLMNKEPKDWDITTDARPEDILKIFPNGKYTNAFGTVILPDLAEVTTFRSEQDYSDRRHPDKIIFEDTLDKDLSRRDFTVNALAMDLDGKITDYFGGVDDIKKKIIRAVGEPSDRFKEDALRMMRMIRFSCQLGFTVEDKTLRAVSKMAGSIKFISAERISAELIKIFSSDNAYNGIMLLHETKLLQYILPELEQAVAVGQSRHHTHDVFTHSVLSLSHCPSRDWRVRFAALLHDIGKPKTRKIIDGQATFYNHEYVGAKITDRIVKRLKFPLKDAEKIVLLVKNHMFYYNADEVTAASVRRLIAKVGEENLQDLIDVRIGDRLGSGVAKAKPYKLRHLEYMFERVRKDPVSVKMLAVNGDELQKELNIPPGIKIGAILECLLAEVIQDPTLNQKNILLEKSLELNKLELDVLRAKAKEVIEEKRSEDDKSMKQGYFV